MHSTNKNEIKKLLAKAAKAGLLEKNGFSPNDYELVTNYYGEVEAIGSKKIGATGKHVTRTVIRCSIYDNCHIKDVPVLSLSPLNISTVKAFDADASFSIDGMDNGSFAIASSKKELKGLMKSNAAVVYDEKKGKLYLNENGEEKGWGAKKDGGLMGNFKGKPELSADSFYGLTPYQENSNNTDEDNSTKGDLEAPHSYDKRILSLETKIESLKQITGPKGETGATGIQGERGPKGEVGATGKQGERGPKGEPGSSSVDTDIITGINSKISKLEKAVELDQKLPNSNNNNINYYLNRNYEITQTIFTELSGIYGRLAASELLIEDLTSVIGTLTGKIEALELGL